MPADYHNIEKYCEICNRKLKLNNNRDIKRKRFCGRKCLGKYMVKEGLLTNDYSLETRERMRESKLKLLSLGWKPLGWRKYITKRRISGRGYWRRGNQREHRVIMEDLLGRKLTINEVVHHIDSNKLNNNPKNLLVMSRSEHMKYHTKQRKLKYA